MANHRWETEPPAVLPSRLAARRHAAGMDRPPRIEPDPGTDSRGGPSLENSEPAWQLPDPEVDEPDISTDPGAAAGNRRRWRFPRRAGILAACLMLAVAAAVPLLRDRASGEVLSVELGSNLAAAGSNGRPDSESPAAEEKDELQPQGERGTSPAEEPAVLGEPEGSGGAAGSGIQLVVHVAGAVGVPGLVRIPEGGRVADAVAAAGGATEEADLSRVNLAALMTDGSMVVVPAHGDPGVPVAAPDTGTAVLPAPGSAAGTDPGTIPGASVVNLNTAGEAELQTLPRVGPVLASRIIAWRTEHGPFQRAEDLDAVPGIGEAMLAALLPLVAV